MEKNRFLEMAVLEAEPVYRKKQGIRVVDVKLTKFLPSLAEVPSKELDALKDRAMKTRESLLSITGRIFVPARIERLKLSVISDMTDIRNKANIPPVSR